MKKMLERLAQKLCYTFHDIHLLETALRHRSVRHNNNERLEFLGDSILNFLITETLYQRYPHATEGKLSRLRAELVREETLTNLAKEFNLGDFLILGPGELKSGGARRSSILADAMEAVIGAIYLDAGFKTCRTLVLQWYESRLADMTLEAASKDPKTELQEWLQSKKMALPQYQILKIAGKTHAQVFHIKCDIPEFNLSVEAEGSTRQKAEKEAARLVLEKLLK